MTAKLLAASAALMVAVGGGAVAAATAASAESAGNTGLLQAALYANGNGSAVWNGDGDPVLNAGNTAGDSAQVDLSGGYAGQQAPAKEPSFTADHYRRGDPRWVIKLHNGCFVTGYPGEGVSSNPHDAWALDGGNSYTTYRKAISEAQNCGGDNSVTAAFIIDDGGYAGTPVTLMDVQYDNQYLPSPTTLTGYDGKALGDYGSRQSNNAKVDLYSPNSAPAQQWTVEPDGAVLNGAAGTGMCLDDPAWGGQGTRVDMFQCVQNGRANERWYLGGGHLVNEANGLCLKDPGGAKANGTQQILWACGNHANENYNQR